MVGIYKITSPSNKIYIGQSVDIKRRWRDYTIYECHIGRLKNSLKKYGHENHIFEIIEECSIELLNERERYFQDFYDVLGENGLNLLLTKTDEKKLVVSKETREKLRILNTGKKHSEETKMKCYLGSIGYKHSEESKEKISKTHKGRVYSEEILKDKRLNVYTQDWKDKISKANKGRKSIQGNSRKKVINTETKKVFGSIREAAESISMKEELLSNRLNGINKKNDTNLIYFKDYKTE